jgi:serine/threonine-protein kinase RsbW
VTVGFLPHPAGYYSIPALSGANASVDPSIRISFPARTEFVRVARLAATGAVSIVDWTVDDVEDFRLAVSEACAHLLSPPSEASTLTVEITLRGRDASVLVVADATASPDGGVPETLAREVVSALGEDVSFEGVDGNAAVRFTKRPAPADDTPA